MIYAYVYVYVYVCVYVCVYIYVYTYIYIYTYTHIAAMNYDLFHRPQKGDPKRVIRKKTCCFEWLKSSVNLTVQ